MMLKAHLRVLPLEANKVDLCLVSPKVAGNMEVNTVDTIELGCTAQQAGQPLMTFKFCCAT